MVSDTGFYCVAKGFSFNINILFLFTQSFRLKKKKKISLTCLPVFLSHAAYSCLAHTVCSFIFLPHWDQHTQHRACTHTHFVPTSLIGCHCSTGGKSLAAACSSPNLPSLCTIALGTKLRPHNSRPACVNSRANTVKAKTHFLLSPTSLAKN